jgi:hypothetical protein
VKVDPAVASALVLGAVSLCVGLLTYRNNRAGQSATNVIENRKVDQSEFDSITRELRESLESVKEDLQHEKDQRRLSNGYARTLAQVLRDHDMPVPPPPDGLDLP